LSELDGYEKEDCSTAWEPQMKKLGHPLTSFRNKGLSAEAGSLILKSCLICTILKGQQCCLGTCYASL